MGRRLICIYLDKALVKQMEEIRDKTGASVSMQIELRLKGYIIRKVGECS